METRLEAVRRILNAATGDGEPYHEGQGRFWNLPRDGFVAAEVYGERVVMPGDPAGSALIKALRGTPPFDGSSYPRMPVGRPPVSDADIEFIGGWIAAGCPDSDPAAKGRRPAVADRVIMRLMSVSPGDHDLPWLVAALQAALKLEFATVPPYLCARWSVVDGLDPVSLSIREIVREEMLHMALVCNLLTAVGETPLLNTPDAVPSYPGPLPGGVHPGLIVPLSGLSREAAAVFMEIEYPDGGPVARARLEGEEFSSIGAFYRAIMTAFERISPNLSAARQLEGPLGLTKIGTLRDVRTAVELIQRQGEGTDASPEDTGPADLAHYYRFGVIYHGRGLAKDPVTGEWRFDGPDVPFPQVWPMASVPPGGYQRADVSAQVWQLLQQFDQAFTSMLDKLQSAWAIGSPATLNDSVATMYSLRRPALQLMQIPRQAGGGNYGPCFRLVRA